MTLKETMTELKNMGSEQTKKILLKHGAAEPLFGVKVGDMKSIQKKVKKDYGLSKSLYESGNGDAMYLAGLIADEEKMTKTDLNKWVKTAKSPMIAEYTVPWIASESKHGWDLGCKWIESKSESIASSGWATLSSWMSIRSDEELDIAALRKLLKALPKQIHKAPNRVRYCMNNFVIAAGSFVPELTDLSMEIAEKIGKVEVFMGETACKVPDAKPYIEKVKSKGRVGKKKKMARC